MLDDFHHIQQREIIDSLQAWLEQFPSNLQLVILGHTQPSLSLGHLRAKGFVTELDANDLRFTLEEGIHYLQQYPQQPPLADNDLEKLVKHTEGWAAGLTLTALALSKQEDRRQFIDTFSGAHIYLREYFMETVLQRSSPDVQAFLLKTAVLKHLTGSLCDAVTGQTGSEELLARLWQENVFIVRLEEQGWYRYHDLFAEMLLSLLQARFPDEVHQLHQHAAQWYRDQNAPADAVYHLLAMEAWEEAAALDRDHGVAGAGTIMARIRVCCAGWNNCRRASCKNTKRSCSSICGWQMWLCPGKKSKALLPHIEANLSHTPAAQRTQDERDVLVEIKQHPADMGTGRSIYTTRLGDGDNDARWEVLNGLHLLKHSDDPNPEALENQLTALLQKAQAQHNLFVVLMVGGVLANRAFVNGQLRRSEKIARQVLEQALAQRGKLPEPASIALAALSQVALERNELELAQRYSFSSPGSGSQPHQHQHARPNRHPAQSAADSAGQGG